MTHERRLAGTEPVLDRFLTEAGALGSLLGVLLVELPPSLPFDEAVATGFFQALRDRHRAAWSASPAIPPGADAALDRLAATIGRVAGEAWCIFDNTAAGAAAGQALDPVARLTGNGLS